MMLGLTGKWSRWALLMGVGFWFLAAACSATNASTFDDEGGSVTTTAGPASGSGGSSFAISSGGPGGGGTFTGDPKTCEEAAVSRSYIGCDFWPTVTPNNVWSVFDFAVVVANTGDQVVDVTVQRGGNAVATAQIAPDSLQTIYLPWVPQLKGPDADAFGSAMPVTTSLRVPAGAYHLTSTFPVTVYQFNALEYAPTGGPPGKNWNSCPADGIVMQCFSYSNDASLLLPSTAMTGNYRILSIPGWAAANMGAYVAVTGTADNTNVTVNTSSTATVVAGNGVSQAGPNGSLNFTIGRGEVVILMGAASGDLSGSLLQASNPVQVISGVPCTQVPEGVQACDHLEESVFPAETLGERYVVVPPTGPKGDAPGHIVRFFGNFDGTVLTYTGSPPAGAPTMLNAGQVVQLPLTAQPFEVVGDKAFAVVTLMVGGELLDPAGGVMALGDPAQSIVTAVEQYRDKYVFLAPTDYSVNYLDVVMPSGTTLTLDGQPASGATTPVPGSQFSVVRLLLNNNTQGGHVLTANNPVGIQVAGYGNYTSYYYPGGLNLKTIAPPPVR